MRISQRSIKRTHPFLNRGVNSHMNLIRSLCPQHNIKCQSSLCLMSIRHISSTRLVCNSKASVVLTWVIQLNKNIFFKISIWIPDIFSAPVSKSPAKGKTFKFLMDVWHAAVLFLSSFQTPLSGRLFHFVSHHLSHHCLIAPPYGS